MSISKLISKENMAFPKTKTTKAVLVFSAILIVGCVVCFLMLSGPNEPVYDGISLSDWIEGKAIDDGRATHEELFQVLNVTVGVEALPWLSWAFPGYVRQKEYEPLYLRYIEFYRKHIKVQRFLPDPETFKPKRGVYDAMAILARISPGTDYEGQVLQALLTTVESDDATIASIRLRSLGNFTNHFELVVPVLISGLTNNNYRTVNTSIDQLKRFGPKVCDVLYPEALKETGHIRPFELAIKKIDPDVFDKLIREKQNF